MEKYIMRISAQPRTKIRPSKAHHSLGTAQPTISNPSALFQKQLNKSINNLNTALKPEIITIFNGVLTIKA
jgi:hypothetical protein